MSDTYDPSVCISAEIMLIKIKLITHEVIRTICQNARESTIFSVK